MISGTTQAKLKFIASILQASLAATLLFAFPAVAQQTGPLPGPPPSQGPATTPPPAKTPENAPGMVAPQTGTPPRHRASANPHSGSDPEIRRTRSGIQGRT